MEANRGYAVDEFAPGILLIGTDGGGAGYAYDFRRQPAALIEVPLERLDLAYAREVGADFDDFFRRLQDG